MPFKNSAVAVRSDGHDLWRTLEDTVYTGKREAFIVPADFVTDFATVPRAITWMAPRYGVYTQAAVLHDWFCTNIEFGTPIISRRDADGIFRRVLEELGVSLPRRWMMWAGVRTAGFMSDATLKEWMQWLLVAIPSVIFLAVPVTIVQVWLIAFWLLERLVSPQEVNASPIWTDDVERNLHMGEWANRQSRLGRNPGEGSSS